MKVSIHIPFDNSDDPNKEHWSLYEVTSICVVSFKGVTGIAIAKNGVALQVDFDSFDHAKDAFVHLEKSNMQGCTLQARI